MLIGIPKESVGIMPSTVRELTDRGHRVAVETRAGAGAGFADNDYRAAGAEIVLDADTIFGHAELIVKVKEPLATERKNCLLGRCCSPIYI